MQGKTHIIPRQIPPEQSSELFTKNFSPKDESQATNPRKIRVRRGEPCEDSLGERALRENYHFQYPSCYSIVPKFSPRYSLRKTSNKKVRQGESQQKRGGGRVSDKTWQQNDQNFPLPQSAKGGGWCEIILTTGDPHPPYSQKYAPRICHTMGSVWHKSQLKSKDFYRKYGIRTPKLWHTNPSLLCHMNRFYSGWGWSLIC